MDNITITDMSHIALQDCPGFSYENHVINFDSFAFTIYDTALTCPSKYILDNTAVLCNEPHVS